MPERITPEIGEENQIKKIADYAARLRREQKLSIDLAVGQALGFFGVAKDEREDIGDKVRAELGRRGGEVTARIKKEKTRRRQEAPYEHWKKEAARAGFDDVNDYLKHINE